VPELERDAPSADPGAGGVDAARDGIVEIFRTYMGTSPEQVRAFMNGNTLVCELEGCFTQVEKTLIVKGLCDGVLHLRRSFQRAMDAEFRRVVEEATGRSVRALLSQVHIDPDLDVEIFILTPAGDEPPSSSSEAARKAESVSGFSRFHRSGTSGPLE
jgi:uncharacterized protein YbcI